MKKGDLVVLAADGGIEQVMRGLLTRTQSLGIRQLEQVEYPKEKALDSRTFRDAALLANQYRTSHEHALVMLDRAWDLGTKLGGRGEMESSVEKDLEVVWGDRASCIVIEPELEVWIWSDSPHVARHLGWDNNEQLRQWLAETEYWGHGSSKPSDPKAAYKAAIYAKRVPHSNSIFRQLAEVVGLKHCQDPAFHKLRSTLQRWFGDHTLL
jgi:hypothetical protein